MSGNTTVSQPHSTTSCSLKTDERLRSGSAPGNKSPSLRPDLVGKQFGWVVVTSPEVVWRGGVDRKGHVARWRHLHVQCTGCGEQKLMSMDNLLKGKTRGCQRCSQPRKHPQWLLKRLTAAKDRCTNPKNRGYANYGGRGIEFRFSSVSSAAEWVAQNIGVVKTAELDRVDNDGHYEPGNLRWSTRAEQSRNQRRSRVREARDWPSPYSEHTTGRLLREGLTRDQIYERARQAVAEKRKGWRSIAAKLASMTS